jgi:hypothetical protein
VRQSWWLVVGDWGWWLVADWVGYENRARARARTRARARARSIPDNEFGGGFVLFWSRREDGLWRLAVGRSRFSTAILG